MPKKLPEDLNERIETEIARHPEGIGIDDLHRVLAEVVSRRTLQRRLAELAGQNQVTPIGKGPDLRYRQPRVIKGEAQAQVSVTAAVTAEVEIRVSPAGEDVRRYVRQPRQQRAPVSYQQAFLEQYTPNLTAYLPEKLRAQLQGLGRSPLQDAPAGTFARGILNRLLIDLSWASSHLEGNTYSRLDTERLIEFGQAAAGKDALETQMILNHKAAIEYLVCNTEQVGVNPQTLIALHAFLSDGLMPDPASCGRLRQRPVEIEGSVYLPIPCRSVSRSCFGSSWR